MRSACRPTRPEPSITNPDGGRRGRPPWPAVAVLALAAAAARAFGARPLLDRHQWDSYFGLFAQDGSVPWKPATVRLDTFSGAQVDFAAYAVDPAEVIVAGASRAARAIDASRYKPAARWRFAAVRLPLRDQQPLGADRLGGGVLRRRGAARRRRPAGLAEPHPDRTAHEREPRRPRALGRRPAQRPRPAGAAPRTAGRLPARLADGRRPWPLDVARPRPAHLRAGRLGRQPSVRFAATAGARARRRCRRAARIARRPRRRHRSRRRLRAPPLRRGLPQSSGRRPRRRSPARARPSLPPTSA